MIRHWFKLGNSQNHLFLFLIMFCLPKLCTTPLVVSNMKWNTETHNSEELHEVTELQNSGWCIIDRLIIHCGETGDGGDGSRGTDSLREIVYAFSSGYTNSCFSRPSHGPWQRPQLKTQRVQCRSLTLILSQSRSCFCDAIRFESYNLGQLSVRFALWQELSP